ncbi:hypothetical protein [Streptomyces sp. NPDC048659]|uniref:hypothetical protein n=1 Tax=Streptomyces sp. NPDC048659 TaxID=3155489 RepID=UPI003449DFB5
MTEGRPELRFHPPVFPPPPEGLAPETARLLEAAVRRAVADAVRAAGGRFAEPGAPGPPAVPPERARPGPPEAPDPGSDGYRVPGYASGGRPVTVRLRRDRGGAGPAGRPEGGLGLGARAGTGGRNLGGGARTGAPAPAPEQPWTPERLAALRRRMGPEYREALLGRISVDDLLVGSHRVRLVPALGGTDHERTVAARLGPGAFHLAPIEAERSGLRLATVPGGRYAVHRVGANGRREDTGLRVTTWDARPVRDGILAYTSDLTTLREITVVGHARPDARAVAAAVADDLRRGLAYAPGSVVAATMKDRLQGLDDTELMACCEELRTLGRLGETLALVRVRAFRTFLRERRVPWSYVYSHWEPNVLDGAQVLAGIVWGAGEYEYQVLELLGTLAGSFFSARLAEDRHRLWTGLVTAVTHPLVTAREGLRALRDAFVEKLDQLEFFDAGRIVGQILMALLTLPEAVASLPRAGRGVVRAVLAVNRIGVAALDRIGLRLLDVLRLLFAERPVLVTREGVLLSVGAGDDILASGAEAKGSWVISRTEISKELNAEQAAERLFTPEEIEELSGMLDKLKRRKPPRRAPGAAVLTVEVLEELVAEAIAEVGAQPGSAGFTAAKRGSRLHSAFSRLVTARFPGSGLTLVSETAIRGFAKLPAALLDTPIEEFVKATPGVAELEQRLKPLFLKDGKPRLIGDLTPDLIVRAPGRLVVFDLTSVEREAHMAKNLLYAAVLRDGGEAVTVGETYWRHFGETAAEIGEHYRKELRAARIQQEAAREVMRRHQGGGTP